MIVERSRTAGDASMIEWFVEYAIKAMPELAWAGHAQAVHRIVEATAEVDRYEIVAFVGNEPAGICVLVSEDDAHVGPCLGIMWNFVRPEYSGELGGLFLKRAIELAKENGLPVVSYTHRVGLGDYRVRYRRLYGQAGKEDCR